MKRRKYGGKMALWVLILTAFSSGLLTYKVQWAGDAPISWAKIAEVNGRLRWRPLWWATPFRIQRWLDGELVGRVQVRWRYPGTVLVIAQTPRLLGIIPKGGQGQLMDEQGRLFATVPLSVTHYPILWLPNGTVRLRCLTAVRQTVHLCAQQKVALRALWVSPFGEVAICLPDGTWFRLGNPFALPVKMQLCLAMRQQVDLPPSPILDVSGLSVVGVWHQPSP